MAQEDFGDGSPGSEEARAGAPGSGQELLEPLTRLLRRLDSPQAEFSAQVDELVADYGDSVFSELIYLLAHLRFDNETARHHWSRINDHRREMGRALGAEIDVRVALISYFVEVSRELENPTVIEMKLLEQTEALAYRDELTGLCNYRFFKEFLRRELPRSERYGDPVSIVLLDVDDFKLYNDSHGHEEGNQALARIGKLLLNSVRRADLAARYGGEEFVLVVPSTPKTGAGRLAEQLRERIEDAFRETQAGSAGGPLTVSLGVATYPADGGEAEELIRNADRALYLAKSGGKNQVQFYERSRRSFRRVRLELRVGISSRGAPSSSCGRSMCRPADCASRVPSKCRSARSSICVSRHRIRIAGWGWWAEWCIRDPAVRTGRRRFGFSPWKAPIGGSSPAWCASANADCPTPRPRSRSSRHRRPTPSRESW